MRRIVKAFFLIATGLLPVIALADDMVATRPGLMCVSAEALAKLTLPNGGSITT